MIWWVLGSAVVAAIGVFARGARPVTLAAGGRRWQSDDPRTPKAPDGYRNLRASEVSPALEAKAEELLAAYPVGALGSESWVPAFELEGRTLVAHVQPVGDGAAAVTFYVARSSSSSSSSPDRIPAHVALPHHLTGDTP